MQPRNIPTRQWPREYSCPDREPGPLRSGEDEQFPRNTVRGAERPAPYCRAGDASKRPLHWSRPQPSLHSRIRQSSQFSAARGPEPRLLPRPSLQRRASCLRFSAVTWFRFSPSRVRWALSQKETDQAHAAAGTRSQRAKDDLRSPLRYPHTAGPRPAQPGFSCSYPPLRRNRNHSKDSCAAVAFFSSGSSVSVASASSNTLATETAFSSATRTTFVGSIIPASTRFTYSQPEAPNP